ncbi:hypothetical protein ACIO53_27575 [Streptomyces sp. NPDC087305]|uniref:hypothetical protein n=1 Tax=Streptomyces sp. NPDC087305 TaxID=3365781 RepID=UPI003810C954
MSASPAVRSLRAAVFAAVCVLLAAAGHGLATGATPPWWADGAGFLVVFVMGWLLGARERSLPGIAAAMLATQAGLHLGFDVARPRNGGMAMAGMAHMSGHAMAPMRQSQAMTPHAVAAHIVAALVAAWWLRRGEAALWSLLRWAVAFVPGLVAWWRDAPAPQPARTTGRPGRTAAGAAPLRQLLLRHAVSRRGPPAPIPYPV